MTRTKRILFICTHNSAWSPRAEGLINTLYGDGYEAFSAGTDPLWACPYTAPVIEEIGINISQAHVKSLERFLSETFDYMLTVCNNAQERYHFFPNATSMSHQPFKNRFSMRGSGEETLRAFAKTKGRHKGMAYTKAWST